MSHSKHLNALALVAWLTCLVPSPAAANGGHLGWCIGVGNPHQNTGCAGGVTSGGTQPTSSQPPQVTPPSAGTGSSAQNPTPQTITVPVTSSTVVSQPQGFVATPATVVMPTMPGGSTVDQQRPVKPLAQTQVPTIVLQASVVAQPPAQGPVSLTVPSPAIVVVPAVSGGTTAERQNPTTPIVHHAPVTSTLQATSVALPPAQGISSVTRPPSITMVTHSPGSVVQITPVATLSRPRPTTGAAATAQVPVLAPAGAHQPPQPVGVPKPLQPAQVAAPLLPPPLPVPQPLQPVATPQPLKPTLVAAPLLQPPLPAKPQPEPVATPGPRQPVYESPPLLPPPVHTAANPPAVLVPPPGVHLPRPPVQGQTSAAGHLALPGGASQQLDLAVAVTAMPPRPDVGVPQPQGTAGLVTGPVTGAWVVPAPGRQPPHDLPARLHMDTLPRMANCLASGFGWRREQGPDGHWRLAGAHPDLRTMDALVRDIPANHHLHSGCVVEVVRRETAKN